VIDFSKLYRAYAADIHRFATLLSGDPTLADDVVSETFIRLWSARRRVDLTTVKSYLLTIARNLVLHEGRHLRRLAAPDVLVNSMADAGPGPEERLRSRCELEGVLAALQTLPEIDRAAVLMRAEEGMTYEEIAAALGISPAAARVKVHRARLKLAEARLAGAPNATRREQEAAR
jgi:RNA polymerase sigma-70 factor (ECF subfamily)